MDLKDIRTKNRLTQAELAGFIGVTQTAIANYENGTRRPVPSVAEKISDFFGLTDKERWNMFYARKESGVSCDGEGLEDPLSIK